MKPSLTAMINPLALHAALQDALDLSIAWSQARPASPLQASNAARSGFFCSAVGRCLEKFAPGFELLQIGFCGEKHGFVAGEWMLDAAIVERDRDRIIRRIQIAMECESSTAKAAFATDFSKLLNIKARTKIYLHGLDHATAKAANSLVDDRLAYAAQLVRSLDPCSEWLIGFWPSPKKVTGLASIWDGASGRYAHLVQVRLYTFNGETFEQVVPGNMPVPAIA